jgi:hypothetical protein
MFSVRKAATTTAAAATTIAEKNSCNINPTATTTESSTRTQQQHLQQQQHNNYNTYNKQLYALVQKQEYVLKDNIHSIGESTISSRSQKYINLHGGRQKTELTDFQKL